MRILRSICRLGLGPTNIICWAKAQPTIALLLLICTITAHASSQVTPHVIPSVSEGSPDFRTMPYSGDPSSQAPRDDVHGELPSQRYENLLRELRCVVCQNQDLLESHAPLAQDLKQDIAQWMQAGRSDTEIRAILRERYGEFILFKPIVTPKTWVLWFGPLVLLLGGLGIIVVRCIRGRTHE